VGNQGTSLTFVYCFGKTNVSPAGPLTVPDS